MPLIVIRRLSHACFIRLGTCPRCCKTEKFDRRRHRFPENRYFEDLVVGERFYIPSRTVTEANFAAFQTVSADNHPIHYDVEYCRERGHPGPLAHGFQVLCFTAAGAGIFAHVIGE